MPRLSAGLLLYRIRNGTLEVLLAHPGGPFFRNKDEGAWTIPKGEIEPHEDKLHAAQREFQEELGFRPDGPFQPLTPVKQKGGKLVHAWACEGDCDPSAAVSNTFSLEWPPRSGTRQDFPEVDEVRWFDLGAARARINPAQTAMLDELEGIVAGE
jgi:predicted NUDIX family NTP pyrophosphohydrolase